MRELLANPEALERDLIERIETRLRLQIAEAIAREVRLRLLSLEEEATPDRLSQRQIQILQAVADGLSGKEIAQQLGIQPKTVRNHLSAAYRVLGTPHAASAVAIGFRQGLLR